MVDEINESIDVVVQLFDDDADDDDDEDDNYRNIENEHTICNYDDGNHIGIKKETEEKTISMVRIPEYRLNARPLYCIQKNDIKLIRQKFKEQNRLLLKTYKSNAMYSCTINEFESKISAFFTNTNAYSLIEEFNETNTDRVQKYLDDLVDKVKTILDNLLQYQSINPMQYHEMTVMRSKVRLDYLFFLPDTRKNEISVQPIMISCESPFINISRLLNRLLEPIYSRMAINTTFFKGADAIKALETYKNEGNLRSLTLFATVHVNNILTIFPHEQAIQVLERFLYDNVPKNQIQGISISTIIQLVRLLLENQWFIYQNKLYRQIHGGGCGSPFMLLLVNIILLDWQKEFVAYLKEKKEIFGRYFDEIFITWNKSKDDLDTFIHSMNMKNSLIQVQSTIGTQIDYLDTYIRFFSDENDNEIELETQVNHESKAEPYALPYIYGHPSDIYSKLIRMALIRAALCCSDIYEFQQERQYIELSFTINNFPVGFISEHVTVFFLEFNMEEFDYTMYDQKTYEELRENVIQYDQKCIQKRMERQQQAHDYNLQYVSLSTKTKFFRYLKQYSQRHRKRSYGNHSKLYVDIVGRPKYPSNTK
ncbi:unnamed protein product [Rotaria magnacalcarata]|nr:unnamed protein product [Rotaria magnacalcarata]CAF2205847.1 unnamed protein product [Rotaria magnacalcarata]CAF4332439.1 unnamed protein product [Rotaria magnacalcarata]